MSSTSNVPTRTLTVDGTEVTLLGTAHVSSQSMEDVRHAVTGGDYDAVAVELCQPRYQRLIGADDWSDVDLFRIVRSGRAGMVAAQLALSAYQKRLGDQLGVEPGGEMRVAVESARERDLPLWLIDREIGITLKRLTRSVPWYQRWTLMTGLLATCLSRSKLEEEEIEQLKEGDVLESTFAEFSERSPTLYRVMIAERDRYMASHILERIRGERPRRLLVVVGAGHLDGLAERLESDPRPAGERAELERIPPRGYIIRILPWLLVVAIILSGFALGFARGPGFGARLVLDWVLINGTLTAIGAILARAHPLTVLTGFIAAPLTSLNPTIGAGMVTGAVETVLRRPRMSDFDTLRDQLAQPRNWWRNRVTRILLVFVFSTAGSAIATYVGGARIIEQLAG
ncbi:MAG: TraB/GumN family protein [Halofilum sp. (in: g-proteobacteria)]